MRIFIILMIFFSVNVYSQIESETPNVDDSQICIIQPGAKNTYAALDKCIKGDILLIEANNFDMDMKFAVQVCDIESINVNGREVRQRVASIICKYSGTYRQIRIDIDDL